jgi:hypothetical protein
MPKIYHEESEEYESEAFYNEEGELLCMFCNNDAAWRAEYMDKILTGLGFEIIRAGTYEADHLRRCKEQWGEW